MSVYSINQTLSGLGVTGLEIMYDFASFNGVTEINSIADADTKYTGSIVNGDSQFIDQNTGSGYFRDQHINIQNASSITSEACTIIFSQEKTGIGPGTLFSNLDNPSGFELGITAANKFYYKNFVDGSPNYVTLGSYGADKNIYAFSMSENGGGALKRLNFKTKQENSFAANFLNANNPDTPNPQIIEYYLMDTEEILVPSYSTSNGNTWVLGSGEFQYEGYMDYFLYFNENIGDDAIRKVVRAVHADTEYVAPATGEVTGIVTGYNVNITGVSGLVGNSITINATGLPSGDYTFASGTPVTGAVGISGEVFVPKKVISGIAGSNMRDQTVYRRITNLSFTHTMTGGIEVGPLENYYSTGEYWSFSGNSGTYNGVEGFGAVGTLVGITGFELTQVTGTKSGVGVLDISGSGVSGSFYSGYDFTPLTSPNTLYTGTGGYFSQGDNEDSSYFAGAISLVGPLNPNYVYEILYDASGGSKINKNAVVVDNGTYNKLVPMLATNRSLSGTNLYINGVSQFTGSITIGTNEFNQPIYNVESGFFIDLAAAFTTTPLSQGSVVRYDEVPNQAREQLTITDVSQYGGAPFSEITEANNEIFFNGVKLLQGRDYTFAGGFRPQGNITNATGVYFTNPSYTGDPTLLRATGVLSSAVSVYGDEITPYGYAIYFNGIRQPTSSIIEHARFSDLITGVENNVHVQSIYTMVEGVTVT